MSKHYLKAKLMQYYPLDYLVREREEVLWTLERAELKDSAFKRARLKNRIMRLDAEILARLLAQ